MIMNVKINNLPSYSREYKYIVVTLVDGELWFYGAYNKHEKAECAVNETDNRLIVENEPETDNKQGHWFIIEYEFLTCSVCGRSIFTGCDSMLAAEQMLADGNVPNYCPYCGAEMDEETE